MYYDGFNLYHAVEDLRQPHLKWCDLRVLGELISRGHAKSIDKAVFCTAYFKGDAGKRFRHESYVNALKLRGVETKLGHTTTEPMSCHAHHCGRRWDQPREKETDINLSLAIFEDALDNVFDVAFVVTADTDQVATFRAVHLRFPQKRVIHVVPPGRQPAKHLHDNSYKKTVIKITASHMAQCLMPPLVMKDGERSINRPREYDPPT